VGGERGFGLGYFYFEAVRGAGEIAMGIIGRLPIPRSAAGFGDDETQLVGASGFAGHDIDAVGVRAPFSFGGVGERNDAAFARRVVAFFGLGRDASARGGNGADADGLVGGVGKAEFTGHFTAAFEGFDGDFGFFPSESPGEGGGGQQEGEAEQKFHRRFITPSRCGGQAASILGSPLAGGEILMVP